MPILPWGAIGGSETPTVQKSPMTTLGFQGQMLTELQMDTVNIGASVALTTEQARITNPYPYFWIWEIYVNVSGTTGNSSSEQSLDVYNTQVAGTVANSILLRGGGLAGTMVGAIPVGINLSVPSFYSARFPSAQQQTAGQVAVNGSLTAAKAANSVYKMLNDPCYREGDFNRLDWLNNYVYKQGQIFSLRALTGVGGAINGCRCSIIGFASSTRFDGM